MCISYFTLITMRISIFHQSKAYISFFCFFYSVYVLVYSTMLNHRKTHLLIICFCHTRCKLIKDRHFYFVCQFFAKHLSNYSSKQSTHMNITFLFFICFFMLSNRLKQVVRSIRKFSIYYISRNNIGIIHTLY